MRRPCVSGAALYVSGWHLPGGGVEVGETAMEALGRELREGNIELQETPSVFGVYFNGHVSRRDHVLLYVVRAFSRRRRPAPIGRLSRAAFQH